MRCVSCYLAATLLLAALALVIPGQAKSPRPVNRHVPPKQANAPASRLDQVTYLSKSKLYELFPAMVSGKYGWPGDSKHPPIPIYPAAKNEAQLHWQVDEYNRMLHKAREDSELSLQVERSEGKNNDSYMAAAARGDFRSMKSLEQESSILSKKRRQIGYAQEGHIFKALGLHRALTVNPDYLKIYQEGGSALVDRYTTTLIQATKANELRFALPKVESTGG